MVRQTFAASMLGSMLSVASAFSYSATTQNMGCYTDSTSRTLTGRLIVSSLNMSTSLCTNACGLIGYSYAGTEYGTQCFCGNSIANRGASTGSNNCGYKCSGDSGQVCGGFYSMNLYRITNPQPMSNNPAFPLNCQNQPLSSMAVCDTTKSIQQRAASLVAQMTLSEKVNNVIDSASGSIRLGLLPYEWWNEALHGVSNNCPGVMFAPKFGDPFSYASSFPEPINLGASFDDPLVASIASVIGQEARAFANNGFSGFDFWTPNINPYRDPRWGRGQETPGEDTFHTSSYVRSLIPNLQGNPSNPMQKQIIATCKHFAGYDIETNRYAIDVNPTQQDLGEYYLPTFQACVRDAGAGSVMCSYNSLDGYPACASKYLLQDVLRGSYNFTQPYHFVVSDCDAVGNEYTDNHFVQNAAQAAAVSLNAGTDLDCGTTYQALNQAISSGYTTEATLDATLTRLYSGLFTIGMFDGNSPYNSLSWSDVNTQNAQALAYQSAMESLVLLKNDGTLPLKGSYAKVAVIGPMAAATTQLQGNYYGNAPYLNSPLSAFQSKWNVVYQQGTSVNTADTSGFAAAVDAANSADLVIFVGGIYASIEGEGLDRSSITWPGNQLSLIGQLAQTNKPLVVIQWGGGQIDDSSLLRNAGVNSLVWAGYPGEDGGPAILDVLTGKWSIAGRLPVTQYPAAYTNQAPITNMNLRPSGSYPGRTYKWYDGTPVLPFGHGLHYTNFTFSWTTKPASSYSIAAIVSAASGSHVDTSTWFTVQAAVKNIGGPANMFSDYVGMLYLSTKNAGLSLYPNKWLVSYTRAHNIAVGSSATLSLPITLGSLARADSNGNLYIYPGTYTLTFDNQPQLTTTFTLTGNAALVQSLPQSSSTYSNSVPVQTVAPS